MLLLAALLPYVWTVRIRIAANYVAVFYQVIHKFKWVANPEFAGATFIYQLLSF